MEMIVLSLAFILTAAIDVLVAFAVLRAKDSETHHLGYALIAGAMVSIFYLMSTLAKNYLFMSVLSSLYFFSVDLALLGFCAFVSRLTKFNKKKIFVFLRNLAVVYLSIDGIGLMINPYVGEFAISYIPVPGSVGLYSYDVHAFYIMHLVYCYSMVLYCVILLIIKFAEVPKFYKGRYLAYLIGFFLIVFLNAIYLFLPGSHIYDISILFYSFFGLYVFFMHFYYLKHVVLNQARDLIVEQLGQGIILFDYEGLLSTYNENAAFLIKKSQRKNHLTLDEFISDWGIRTQLKECDHDLSFMWNGTKQGRSISYRVDFRRIKDRKGRIVGTLFVLVDNALEVDILTGFDTQANALRAINSNHFHITTPCVIAACDIERLSSINEIYGRATGDDALSLLANIMRSTFPSDSHFIRCQDATLVAVASSMNEREGHECLESISNRLKNQTACSADFEIQCCVEMILLENQSIEEALQRALSGLRSRKLLVENSSHSSLISSLAQMQRQGDGETEAHVQRTRRTGECLGRRLGLSDAEINDFALLCLLHDIGKVGVPLEILNKPGRLTDIEWDVMRSHATKGYNIALASNELSGIAEYILHHHENWDGSGYPDGLAHDAIPLLSRMVSVVDTFDAMTHNRPYRRAIRLEDAKDELRRCAGTQFDPTIVAEFLAMIEEQPELATSEWEPEVSLAEAALISGNSDNNRNGDASSTQDKGDDTNLADNRQTARGASKKKAAIDNEIDGTFAPALRQYARYQLDESQHIVEINEEFTKMTGYTTEDLETYHLTQRDLIPEEDRESYWNYVSTNLTKDHAVMLEHRLITKSGITFYVMCYGREYFDAANKLMRYEIIAANLQETTMSEWLRSRANKNRERAQQRWEDTLRKDATGVLTRSAFRNDAQLLLMDNDAITVLMMLDVDFFKQYNDSKGHPKGDALLVRLAQILQEACEENGFAGRFGGDEFAIVKTFKNGTPVEIIEKTVANTWKKIDDGLFAYDGVHVTLGAARAKGDDLTFSALYAAADNALYDAKANGRNCYRTNL